MTAKMLGASFRYDDTVVDEDSLRKVKEELKETDEKLRKGVETLKKKLKGTEGLNPCLEDIFLVAYLRVTKYDINKAYQRIIGLYTERYNLPEVYLNYSPSTVKVVENARKFFMSPYRAQDNSAVLIIKRLDYDPSKLAFDVILRTYSMVADIIMHHPLNQMFGYTILLDLKSSSWSGWSEYTPARLKLIARLLQKSVALRIRALHIINAPSIYFLLYSIIYPFLSHKIRSRIFIHKNNKSVHDYVDPENISKEYDGCLEESELINLFDRIYEQEEFLQKYSKYGFIKKVK